ncbi:hypothetical protein [Nocardioides solisilvae]|uniref:hypothetical protein n=1 Tax=Nocardioides solisilvae TaxID=1542435 RepID=UPI000D747528|nr:hypothetical protein [Nocardioides solisilvae]
MKGCLAFAVVLAVTFGIALGAVALLARGGGETGDDSGLTQEVTGFVVDSRRSAVGSTRGHEITFRYSADGRWWESTGFVNDRDWKPGDTTHAVCIDPEDPATNRTISRLGAACGDAELGPGRTARAETSVEP